MKDVTQRLAIRGTSTMHQSVEMGGGGQKQSSVSTVEINLEMEVEGPALPPGARVRS